MKSLSGRFLTLPERKAAGDLFSKARAVQDHPAACTGERCFSRFADVHWKCL